VKVNANFMVLLRSARRTWRSPAYVSIQIVG
jgi:hypothetical protein